jgi:hypothetical protein
MPEAWLNGPIDGIDAHLMPVAHACVQAREDVSAAVADLTPEQVWARPGGAASVGFHMMHLAGSLDRLFTYARGEVLSDSQKAALKAEGGTDTPERDALIALVRESVDRALAQLRATPRERLLEDRRVGRAGLPSNVLGLLFHGAEHAQRHVGQIITTAKIVKSGR